MSTTISVIGVTASTLSTLVPTVDQTKLILTKITNNSDGSVTNIYTNRASDARNIDTVHVTTKRVVAAGKPVYVEWRLVHNTFILADDGVTDSNDVWMPSRVEIAGRMPLMGQTLADTMAHIGTVYGMLYPSAVAGVPNTKQGENIHFASSNWFASA